jgi:hypothetical protein
MNVFFKFNQFILEFNASLILITLKLISINLFYYGNRNGLIDLGELNAQ